METEKKIYIIIMTEIYLLGNITKNVQEFPVSYCSTEISKMCIAYSFQGHHGLN